MGHNLTRLAVAGAIVIGIAGCADNTSPSGATLAALTASLSTVPLGYGDLSSSFVGAPLSDKESAGFWLGGGRDRGFDRGELMGGGLHDAFDGAIPFTRRDGGHGPFGGGLPCTAAVDATTGFITCTDTTRNGVTITRAAKYTTTAGDVQSAFDPATTNTVVIQTTANGTMTYDSAGPGEDEGEGREHHWGRGRGPGGRLLGDTSTILTATTTLTSASSRTTSGLASGSTERTVNGASAGSETTTGTSTLGSFSASRTVGDTTTGLVIPVVMGPPSYPSAGTVIRSMTNSIQYSGQSPVTVTRREVITYDGSATVKVVITEDGTTKNCTRPLPHGRLTCS